MPCPPPTSFCSQRPPQALLISPSGEHLAARPFLSELSPTPLVFRDEEDAVQGHNDPLPSPWFSSKLLYTPFPFFICDPGRVGIRWPHLSSHRTEGYHQVSIFKITQRGSSRPSTLGIQTPWPGPFSVY